MMGRSAQPTEASVETADRGMVGCNAAKVARVLASDPDTQELDESSLAILVKFFQLLDRWHREANSRC